jgi:hypothetical protein
MEGFYKTIRLAIDARSRSVTVEQGIIKFRTLFISDVHLGARGCQAGHLLDFLR